MSWNKSGKITAFGAPEGKTGAIARAIDDDGTVQGYDDRRRDARVWTKEDGFTLLEDFGFNAEARDINAHGILSGVADQFPFDQVAVVWHADGNIYTIQQVAGLDRYYFMHIDGAPGAMINDNDDMVVYGCSLMNGHREAVVLRLSLVD